MIGTEDGLFESRDNGVTFDQIRLDDESHRVKVVAFDPRTADTIYDRTAMRSSDRLTADARGSTGEAACRSFAPSALWR
jgi:hypothetical protein